MKKIVTAIAALVALNSCNIFRYSNRGELTVENFKTEIPFEIEKEMAIVIPVGVGTNNEQYRFHFDTHAPSTAFEAKGRLASYPRLKYLGSSSLKVRTTSGEKFNRKYFLADFVYLGNVLIKDVSLMEMPGNDAALKDTTYPKVDGLLGLSLMRKGIWKIDFEKNIITFTSSMDSLKKVDDKVLFAKSNVFDIFKTTLAINDFEEEVAIDFGSNAFISLPLNEMKKLKNFSKAELKEGTRKTAAGVSKTTSYRLYNEPVVVSKDTFTVKIIGTKEQTKSVIGLNFFRQFKYVIIDYPASALYVSANRN